MTNTELAKFIAEFVVAEQELIVEAIDCNDEVAIQDAAYDYIENCN